MRYTKIALAIFGLGLMAGFVIVVGEFARLERVAGALMAVGLVLLPVALVADGRAMALRAWLAAHLPRRKPKRARPKSPAKSSPAAARRKPSARAAARRPRRS